MSQQFLLEVSLKVVPGPGKELVASVVSNWQTGWMLVLDSTASTQWLAD